eukprot:3641-Heterococcus_DN1.PRE.2
MHARRTLPYTTHTRCCTALHCAALYAHALHNRAQCACGRTDDEGVVYQRCQCCHSMPWELNPDGTSTGRIHSKAVLWLRRHRASDYEQCKMCPFCVMLPAFSQLQKAANHPAQLQCAVVVCGCAALLQWCVLACVYVQAVVSSVATRAALCEARRVLAYTVSFIGAHVQHCFT